MKELNNIWTLPIGDWSCDGHGRCNWYTIKSNFTVEETREAYFKSTEQSEIDISKTFAYDYEDNSIEYTIINKIPDFIEELLANNYIYTENNIYYVSGSNSMVNIFLKFIKKYNPEFEYEILNIPMLPFYGFDKKHRHIGFIGYGLF